MYSFNTAKKGLENTVVAFHLRNIPRWSNIHHLLQPWWIKEMTGDSVEEAGNQVYVVGDELFSFKGMPRPQELLPSFSSGVLAESAW